MFVGVGVHCGHACVWGCAPVCVGVGVIRERERDNTRFVCHMREREGERKVFRGESESKHVPV